MQHFVSIHKRNQADVGFIGADIDPLNNKGRVGKRGINKNFTLETLVELAYEVDANIIIKTGQNAKWYLKKFPIDNIENEICKQSWRDTSRTTMWIIEWRNSNNLYISNNIPLKDKDKESLLIEEETSYTPEWLLRAEQILKETI